MSWGLSMVPVDWTRLLLSPPTSPQMSTHPVTSAGSNWQSCQPLLQPLSPYGLGLDRNLGLGSYHYQHQAGDGRSRPVLRSHTSVPYSLSSSIYSSGQQHISPGKNPTLDGMVECPSTDPSLLRQTQVAGNAKVEAVCDQSAPTSPSGQLTPTSIDVEQDNLPENEEEIAMIAAEFEEDTGDDTGVGRSAAERRAEKRKMKRFRLTHNQTRFLMSEFARQAHPDAAQRERLSREIPGLSPRQVQVWFQNRRAKLKRFTSDDRERMMKSRALPENFDMTQALHLPFGAHSSAIGSPIASPASYASAFSDIGSIRPLMGDVIRRHSEDDSIVSPLSMSSAFSNFYTPPNSVRASKNLSPISPTGERFHAGLSQANSPRITNPFIRSGSFSTTNRSQPYIPKLQIRDRLTRTRAESLASPLRSSMSYIGNALDYGESQCPVDLDAPRLAQDDQPEHNTTNAVDLPYGLAYSSTPRDTFHALRLDVSSDEQAQGFRSSAQARIRSGTTPFPLGLDLRLQSRSLGGISDYQRIQAPQGLQSAPLTAPQDFQSAQFSIPYRRTAYLDPYGNEGSYNDQVSRTDSPTEDDQASGTLSSDIIPNISAHHFYNDDILEDTGGNSLNLRPAFNPG